MFERFTEDARRALFFARYEATQLGSAEIEPEHLLLGVLREPLPFLQPMIEALTAPVDTIRVAIEQRSSPPAHPSFRIEVPFASLTKRIFEYTAQEADSLRHDAITAGHLLLGILRAHDSVAAALLAERGLTLTAARDALARADAPGG